VSIAAFGALALAAVTAGTANAGTVTSGTVTLTINDSYLSTLHNNNIDVVPTGAASVTDSNGMTTVVYNATGGDANLSIGIGHVDYAGGLTVRDESTNQSVQLSSLQFDVFNNQFDAAPSGGSEVALVDPAGPFNTTIGGSPTTFTAGGLVIDAAGASYLNSTLGTTRFQAGQNIGSFATTVSD